MQKVSLKKSDPEHGSDAASDSQCCLPMYESHTICRSSIEFMRLFKYVRVDKRNPMVERNEWLREIMVQRRTIHKLFDLIKCTRWQNIFEQDGRMRGKRIEEDAG